MNKEQAMVKEFHEAFELLVQDKPGMLTTNEMFLRIALMAEEFDELTKAMHCGDIVAIADGLADLLYVVYGSAVAYGLDMEPLFEEVHRSNMTKVGGKKRADGKLVKPKTYDPPNLNKIIMRMF
jgi:predicted HAD superfamily Cof-like phosphohydrolase